MATIYANGRPVAARPGEMLLDALRRAGISVPTLCHVDGLAPSGACRLCVVEVEGGGGLVPSCAFPVSEGLRVRTHSPRALAARKTMVELLLANHPDDCLYCVRSGACRLQDLAEELGVRQRRYGGARAAGKMDTSCASVVREPAKCVLCGRCVRVCEEVQGVAAVDFQGRGSSTRVGTAFGEGLGASGCVGCGQCIASCPTGALREQSHIGRVLAALEDAERIAVVQHAPAAGVSLGEEFGLKPGADLTGQMTAALRAVGFRHVFDGSLAADVAVMETASDLAERMRAGVRLPLVTSCCPGWVRFVEQECPEFIENLSTCRSPQQAMGVLVKTCFAERHSLDPARMFCVAVGPCTALKLEAERPESGAGVPDVDAVLTTRELAQVLRVRGVDVRNLASEPSDPPLGECSTAGRLFGVSGGAAEAVLRTLHFFLTGKELEHLKMPALRGLNGPKETRLRIGDLDVGVAVASGLASGRRLLDDIRAGRRRDLHLVEVAACPGGCVAGGGQPLRAGPGAAEACAQALYKIDREEQVRAAHANDSVRRIYRDYLGRPLGRRSRELLHTRFARRHAVL